MRYPALLTMAVVAVLLVSCDDRNEGPVTAGPASGMLVSASSCKQTADLPRYGAGSTSESCIEYQYEAETATLHLRHVNAGFNCCPGQIGADISVENGVITIAERESEASCRCDCLYDLEFVVENLSPGTYRIVVVEPYRPQDADELNFTVDFGSQTSGTHCVVRTTYPWGN